MRNRSGFTLMELMVAVGIVATALLLVMGVLTLMLRPSQKGVDQTAGALLAQSLLDQEIYQIQNGTGAVSKAQFFGGGPGPPMLGQVALDETTYQYIIYYEDVSHVVTGPLGGADPELHVKKADITLWWWNEDSSESRQGYGQLRADASRIVLYAPDS